MEVNLQFCCRLNKSRNHSRKRYIENNIYDRMFELAGLIARRSYKRYAMIIQTNNYIFTKCTCIRRIVYNPMYICRVVMVSFPCFHDNQSENYYYYHDIVINILGQFLDKLAM